MNALTVIQKIDDGYDAEEPQPARSYIGASGVGHPCDANLAFSLRGFPNTEPDARLKRIFRLGHILEDEVVRDLKTRADVRVWETDGLTGAQHRYEDFGGHLVCHMDGHIQLDDASDEILVLEIKTMNDGSWKKFEKEGVKRSHPQYYAQLQFEMGLSGIERAFFIAVNKNTSAYHAEIVSFDPLEYAYLRERVSRAFEKRAEKVATDESDWRCRGCFKRDACWNGKLPEVACQSCAHATATADGWWHCDLHDRTCCDPCDHYAVFKPEERT